MAILSLMKSKSSINGRLTFGFTPSVASSSNPTSWRKQVSKAEAEEDIGKYEDNNEPS
jgi:hypothetical protein